MNLDLKPRETLWIDKQSMTFPSIKDPTQCYSALVAQDPKDKSGDYLDPFVDRASYDRVVDALKLAIEQRDEFAREAVGATVGFDISFIVTEQNKALSLALSGGVE